MRTRSANAMIPGSSLLSIVRHHQDPYLLYVIPCTHLALARATATMTAMDIIRDREYQLLFIIGFHHRSLLWCSHCPNAPTGFPVY